MPPPPPIVPGPGRARQNQIYRAGVQGRTPAVPTDFATLERRARRRARKLGWAYAAGGAGEGATLNLDIDPNTHPAWTGGSQQLLDRGGRLSRFNTRFAGIGLGKK